MERPGKGRKSGKLESQWPTLKSGPLARAERPENGWKPGKVSELVDYSGEWTTSSGGKAGKGPEIGERGGASDLLLRVDH